MSDREGSKHSTAATLGREDSQAAVLPQAFEDRVHARQLDGVVQESGAKDESSRFGTLTFNMTHASERGAAARKSQTVTRIAGVQKFVGSRFTPTCNTSAHVGMWVRGTDAPSPRAGNAQDPLIT